MHNPSEVELAEIRKKYGGISASEAWQERFGTGQFQRDIQLAKVEYDETEEEEMEP